jgi:hypothetical protein
MYNSGSNNHNPVDYTGNMAYRRLERLKWISTNGYQEESPKAGCCVTVVCTTGI